MEASSSFYIPPRPDATPLQRRRAIKTGTAESGDDEQLRLLASVSDMFTLMDSPVEMESPQQRKISGPSIPSDRISRSKTSATAPKMQSSARLSKTPSVKVPTVTQVSTPQRSKTTVHGSSSKSRNITPPVGSKSSAPEKAASSSEEEVVQRKAVVRSKSLHPAKTTAEIETPEGVTKVKSRTRSKSIVGTRPEITRSSTTPPEIVSKPSSSSITPHPRSRSSSQQLYQQGRRSSLAISHTFSPDSEESDGAELETPVGTSYLMHNTVPSTGSSEFEDSPCLPYTLGSPEAESSAQFDNGRRRRSSGPRQPIHPAFSRQAPEQITILKGSQSAYPLLHKKSKATLIDVAIPSIDLEGCGGRPRSRSRSSTPDGHRPTSRLSKLRSSTSQTLPNGYTFPTSISQSIPRSAMRPLCAVKTAGYTDATVTPLLPSLDTDSEQEDENEALLSPPIIGGHGRAPSPFSVRRSSEDVPELSPTLASPTHGVVMINGRPFSPLGRAESPDMSTQESSMPVTPDISDLGHGASSHGHSMMYSEEGVPTLEQLIAEQNPIVLRPVDWDDAGSAFVVDLSKKARKAAKKAEKLAEKEAKKEAKAVRRATKRRSSVYSRKYKGEETEGEVDAEADVYGDENAIRKAALLAEAEAQAQLELERQAVAKLEEERKALEQEQNAIRAAQAALQAERRRSEQEKARAETMIPEQPIADTRRRSVVEGNQMVDLHTESPEMNDGQLPMRPKLAAKKSSKLLRVTPKRQSTAPEPFSTMPLEDSIADISAPRRGSEPVISTSATAHKTAAQLEKEAYEASRRQSEQDLAAKDIHDASRVENRLSTMATELAVARRARRDSKVLDYGYPSAEYDPPHRTEGVGLKLVTSTSIKVAKSPKSPGASQGEKSKRSKMAAILKSTAGQTPGPSFQRGFRSISYADLEEAAEDHAMAVNAKTQRAELAAKSLEEERQKDQEYKEWLRRVRSTEAAKRIPVPMPKPGRSSAPVGGLMDDLDISPISTPVMVPMKPTRGSLSKRHSAPVVHGVQRQKSRSSQHSGERRLVDRRKSKLSRVSPSIPAPGPVSMPITASPLQISPKSTDSARMSGTREEISDWETEHSDQSDQSSSAEHGDYHAHGQISDDSQWEDVEESQQQFSSPQSSKAVSLSDQEVNFQTSDLDSLKRHRSRRSVKASTPKPVQSMERPAPMRRVSTVKLISLEGKNHHRAAKFPEQTIQSPVVKGKRTPQDRARPVVVPVIPKINAQGVRITSTAGIDNAPWYW